ncbi:MAG TPA: winged helix-turn-helix domain-containing protein [Kineosporiaceae bacterium]|nr:winged helix-turn-helix domain-containing protein [Kineosporiaceae bacterium]
MRTSAPPLLAVFRSQLQGEVLARVLLAREPITIADLSRELAAPLATVAREVNRLKEAGILSLARQGRAQLVTGNDLNPAVAPLRDLVAVAFGPRYVVTDEFAELAGLEELFIFGSWAARYAGQPGPVPGDVDVLAVGVVDRDEVYDAADRAARRLRREVNPTVVSPKRWASISELADPFVREVRNRPLVRLHPPDTPPLSPKSEEP